MGMKWFFIATQYSTVKMKVNWNETSKWKGKKRKGNRMKNEPYCNIFWLGRCW